MKHILILGAGRSSFSLIQYMMKLCAERDWQMTVGDLNVDFVKQKIGESIVAKAIVFNATDSAQCDHEVSNADIVISLLPPRLHHLVALACLKHRKNLVTASYVSAEMKMLDKEAKEKGLLFLNEIGLDPGIDHLSAMKTIDQLKNAGHQLHAFESFTGGLVAPESDNNPWGYKISWNPKNVVLAGQGTPVKFRQEGKFKYIPYHKLFRRTEIIDIEGYGRFEGYANRDSLKYEEEYNLHGIPTIYRGTLRRPGFCRAWDVFVQLGATDDSYTIEGSEDMTYRDFINLFLSYNPYDSVEIKLMHYLHIDQDDPIMEKLTWLGIFEKKKIGIKNATPAQILQKIIEEKWVLNPEDKDMIVMWNKFEYYDKTDEGKRKMITSSLVVKGDNQLNTAMAKTVGLPLGIAAKLILEGKTTLKGVHIPTTKELYEPILAELKLYGIEFKEKLTEVLKPAPVI
ncbi:MAG: saccharopine dehydrogenase C-terminal domain-containing protein [Flammeovirgaceae bacterium]